MRRVEFSIATILSLSLIVILYAVVRIIQAFLFPEPNPAQVIWMTRIAMFWRLGVVTYFSLMVAPLALRWVRRDRLGACRAALWGVSIAAVLILFQSLVFP